MPFAIRVEAHQRSHFVAYIIRRRQICFEFVVEWNFVLQSLGNPQELLLVAILWNKAKLNTDVLDVELVAAVEDVFDFHVIAEAGMHVSLLVVLPVEVS